MLYLLAAAVVLAFLVAVVVNATPREKWVRGRFASDYDVGDEQFVRSMGHLLGPPFVGGNRVTLLRNGDEIFPAMLAAMETAEASICFESYIYWKGDIGHRFAEVLERKARAGVRCHVLLDWLGSISVDKKDVARMKEAGVEVEAYHRLSLRGLLRINNRTHRKLLVVDGRVGFTGGVGVADEWTGDGTDPKRWRDMHYRVDGPVVADMQAAFLDNWMKVRRTLLDGPAYFPALEKAGDEFAQVFSSSPTQGNESVRLMYLMAIASARESILLANAYFMPDRDALAMLEDADRRGVRVELLLPGPHIDAPATRYATRGLYGRLLKAGVRIFEYQPAMFHCKYLVVDGAWVSVGSTNFDNRSFRLNDEANLNVLDRALAARHTEVYEADKARAKEITLEQWQRRPLFERVVDALTTPLRGQL